MKNKSYCAFLRGVNVKGTNMKMAEVCAVFETAGFSNVSSILASGNILFSSDKEKNEIKKTLEKVMSEHFNYEAFLFVKDKIEVLTLFNNNPFTVDTDFHIYGFAGIDGIEKTLLEEFEKSAKTAGETAQIVGENFYWKVPKGNTLDSTFGKILGRKNLKDTFTSRNLNTFEKVLKKM
ncbi:MAG TPA: DUF1697 domain-containing protein [Crocinitomicaceae bacterium]|nr:DUF1697 domain-containing protein [Crocinitomicaceae bacterium]